MRRVPFTILVDTAEQHPWTFSFPHVHVSTERKYLGVHREKVYYPRGDYAIKGYQERCHIERKAPEDIQGVVLGFNGSRDRFERELAELDQMELSAVIVECSMGWLLANPPCRGSKPADTEAKILLTTIITWQRQFPTVRWWFADTRTLAEVTALKIFENFWRHKDDKST
jgi:hypothetical protein